MIALTLMLYSVGVMAQKTVTIKGTVKGDLKGHNKIYVYGRGIKSDSAIISNGNFEFTLPFTKAFVPLFYDEYDARIKGGISPYPVVIDQPGTVYIKDIDIEKGFTSGKVSGIKSAEEFYEFNSGQQEASREIHSTLEKKYGKQVTSKSPDYERYVKDFETLNNESDDQAIKRFVKLHPDSYTSAFLLLQMKSSLPVNDLERTYQVLSKNMQGSENGKVIAGYIAGVKSSGIGQFVKDFVLNTPDDKPLAFSELKGKYVIVDFWASWCGPCKGSFPHMKEIYNKYKGDKFEIYSISVDQSKSDWLNELKKLELPWLQTLDTKNIASGSFAVSAVPTTYMIDPQGKIILKEVGFNPDGSSALEKKLIELFGDKKTK